MRVRWAVVALASGTLALGLLAPGAVTAAPKATKPSGEAMVRIDGGNARAIERGSKIYRIVMPREAAILWLGDSDRRPTIGTLGRKGLIKAWARMGHSSSGESAMATITWLARGDARPTYVGAYVGKPKVGTDGMLTFLAGCPCPAAAGRLPSSACLPQTLLLPALQASWAEQGRLTGTQKRVNAVAGGGKSCSSGTPRCS